MSDVLHRAMREHRREMALGTHAACANCGESNRATLHKTGTAILCYECLARREGKSGMERHHTDGQHNSDFTIPLAANEHRILSEYQRAWPKATLENPDGSPLLKIAAALRGFLDMLKLLIDRLLGWIPPTLEAMDAALRSAYGRYWEQGPLAGCFGGMP